MTSTAARDRMRDYIVGKLEESALQKIEPFRKKLIQGIESTYVMVGEKGLVLLADQKYPSDSFERLHRAAIEQGRKDVAFVFLKDDKTFFRSSVAGEHGEAGLKSMRFKKRYGLSLKNYNEQDLRNMITFRPEETYVIGRSNVLQYYQPQSDELPEGLETFVFKPVKFDYSHIPYDVPNSNGGESKRLHIWTKRRHNTSPLVLVRRHLWRKDVYEAEKAKAEERAKQAEALHNNPRFTKQ